MDALMVHGLIMTDKMRFSIGGYMGKSHLLELTDSGLWHTTTEFSDPSTERKRRLEPTPAQWVEFWQAVEQLGVWDWQPDYTTPDVCDGTGWSLELRHAGRSVVSGGDNGYPGGDGPSYSRTSPFARFLRELEKLAGVKGIN